MSSQSDSRGLASGEDSPPAKPIVSSFEYRLLRGKDLEFNGENNRSPLSPSSALNSAHRQSRPAREELPGQAVANARQQGFEEGRCDGESTARASIQTAAETAVAQVRMRLTDAIADFHSLRNQYFADVEKEVVKLSLAIAARVLHREVQMDPLLLKSAVRVALEKLTDRNGIVLRVPPDDMTPWEGIFHATDPSQRPLIKEDCDLVRGECVLETHMGTVELGIGAQLEEIEKGFFDLLHHRPVQ